MSWISVTVRWDLIRFRLWCAWTWLRGRKRCPACLGVGRVWRLDAGYMRRFGLRPWDGCRVCGGELGRPGTGLVP